MQTRTRPDGAVEVTKSKAKAKGKPALTRVEIEPAENGGAAVRCMYDSGIDSYEKPTLKAYGSIDEALAGIKAMFGGASADKDDAKDED